MKKLLFAIIFIFSICFCGTINAQAKEQGSVTLKNVTVDPATNIITADIHVSASGDTDYYEVELCMVDDNEIGYFQAPSYEIANNSNCDLQIAVTPSQWFSGGLSYLKSGAYYFQCVLYHVYKSSNCITVNNELASSNKIYKQVVYNDDLITMSDYSCTSDGHKYGDWKTVVEPTCISTGSKQRVCKVCGEIEKDTIEKLTAIIKMDKTASIYCGCSKKLKVTLSKGDAIRSAKILNKKIATVTKSGNYIKINAKKIGKTTLTVKTKYGKKASCTIKVTKEPVNFSAKIVCVKEKSDGRGYVTVKFKNKSSKPLIILANGTYYDYAGKYSVTNSKNKDVIIKGKASKTISFVSSEIWNFAGRQDPDIFNFLNSKIKFNFKFNGKKYKGITKWIGDEEDAWISEFKIGGKYKSTLYSERK